MEKIFSFIKELKRRNVIKAGISYLIVSWVVIQVVSVISTIFIISSWIPKGIFIFLIVGLPFWLIFAWIYEMTPEGIKKTVDVTIENSKALKKTDRKLNIVIITFLSIAIGFLIIDRFRITEKIKSQSIEQIESKEKSIAVLPFIDLSPNKDQEYFSDGLSEELLNLLAKISTLKVTSRTSAFSFKNTKLDIPSIARKLDVAYVLEGSVRKSKNQLRITVQLIKVEDDKHLWSETWDREMVNIFDIQDEIAKIVVNYLKLNLLDDDVPKVIKTNTDAYALFLMARHSYNLSTKAELIKAEKYIKQSLKLDKTYIPGLLLLADIYLNQGNYNIINPSDALRLSKSTVNLAIKQDSTSALSYAILGDIALAYEWDFKKAKQLNKKALQLDPNNSEILDLSSTLELALGNIDKAISLQEYSVIIDPLNAGALFGLGVSYFNAKRYEEAEYTIIKALNIEQDLWAGNYYLCLILMYQDKLEEALKITEREYDEGWKLNNKALIYFKLGDEEKSKYYTQQLIEHYDSEMAFQIAEIYAYKNNIDLAFIWLEKAYDFHDIGLNEMLIDPFLENLKKDPRWAVFIKKMGF